MVRARSYRWFIAAAAAASAMVAVAAWIALAPSPNEAPTIAAAPGASPGEPARPAAAPAPAEARDAGPSETAALPPAATTVVWPVQVELELVRAAHLPRQKGVAPIRSGATARLTGSVLGRGAAPLAATVEFIGGANSGRVLACNADGRFGAADLYPGLSVVRIEAPGGLSAVREARLRQNREEVLHVGFDLPGEVAGTVFDAEGKPLPQVEVTLDGHLSTTDENGVFRYAAMAAGDNLQLVLRKDGYATVGDRIAVAAGRRIEAGPQGPYRYTMLPAAALEVTLGPRVGARGESTIVILPEQLNQKRNFPWHTLSPRRAHPGTTVRFDGLPAMRVRVRVFHEGAEAEPEQGTVVLHAGDTAHHSVRFKPGETVEGVVLDREGRRLEGARVTCEVPDRVGATIQYMQMLPIDMESEVIPPLPPAVGETVTHHDGEFVLSAWPKFGGARYLTAVSADGSLWGGKVVTDPTQRIELVLAPIEEGAADLSLDFTGRHQGVPVVVTIDGEPRAEESVPAGEPLVVRGLATGTWRIKAAWNGRSILGGASGEEFELDGDATRAIALPQGAVEGQDADTRLRAGKATPPSYAPADFAPPRK
jgi:protocatechuate 3,4-dioxygenase beta subunit